MASPKQLTVLITGASSGIARALSVEMATLDVCQVASLATTLTTCV